MSKRKVGISPKNGKAFWREQFIKFFEITFGKTIEGWKLGFDTIVYAFYGIEQKPLTVSEMQSSKLTKKYILYVLRKTRKICKRTLEAQSQLEQWRKKYPTGSIGQQ